MVSVAATHDVIETALRYLQNPVSPIANLTFMKEEQYAPGSAAPAAASRGIHPLGVADIFLPEDAVFNQILPNFETVFVGRDFHR